MKYIHYVLIAGILVIRLVIPRLAPSAPFAEFEVREDSAGSLPIRSSGASLRTEPPVPEILAPMPAAPDEPRPDPATEPRADMTIDARADQKAEPRPEPTAAAGIPAEQKAFGNSDEIGYTIDEFNRLNEQQLTAFDGIGPALAAAIVEYRTLHGGFGSFDELTNVRGIGEKKLRSILGTN